MIEKILSGLYRLQFTLPSFLLPFFLLLVCCLTKVLVSYFQEMPFVLDLIAMIAAFLSFAFSCILHFVSRHILRKRVSERDPSEVTAKQVTSFACINRNAIE